MMLSPVEKKLQRAVTTKAINDGTLLKKPCEVCGATEDVQAHHEDYSKPLDIRWLCIAHHHERHKKLNWPGRKRTGGTYTVPIQVQVDPKMKAQAMRRATLAGVGVSGWVRQLIIAALRDGVRPPDRSGPVSGHETP